MILTQMYRVKNIESRSGIRTPFGGPKDEWSQMTPLRSVFKGQGFSRLFTDSSNCLISRTLTELFMCFTYLIR